MNTKAGKKILLDGEVRMLYRIEHGKAGEWIFHFDRNDAVEVEPETRVDPPAIADIEEMGLVFPGHDKAFGDVLGRNGILGRGRFYYTKHARTYGQRMLDDTAVSQKTTFGCLTTLDDFKTVLCHKKPYDLTDATQARALLRFLCAKKAQNQGRAQKKAEILEALQSAGGTVASDWRPAHVFRGKLAALYRDAIGRNATKGLYWINP